ncbi:MAG: helix-turn-helix domain-containing protein [Nitrososphaerales archaeon]
MLQVTLSVKMDCPWLDYLQRNPDGNFIILQCIPRAEEEGVSALAKVNGPDWAPERITQIVTKHPSVKRAKFMTLNPSIFLGMVTTKFCPCSSTLLPYYNHLKITSEDRNRLRWTLLINGSKALKKLTKSLEDKSIDYKIEEIREVKYKEYILTAKQEQLIRAALELGFYDVPRRIRLRDLAKVFNISPRALSERIRRAHKRIILIFLNSESLQLMEDSNKR